MRIGNSSTFPPVFIIRVEEGKDPIFSRKKGEGYMIELFCGAENDVKMA
jgi:hypothetical protein